MVGDDAIGRPGQARRMSESSTWLDEAISVPWGLRAYAPGRALAVPARERDLPPIASAGPDLAIYRVCV